MNCIISFFKITRWPNVCMTVVTQFVVVYGLLGSIEFPLGLNIWQLVLLVSATALLTAAGNVINDIYDIATDKVNKPHKVIVGKLITEDNAFYIYMALNIIGVICGFILANSIDKPFLAVMFVLVALSLYGYAVYLKSKLLLGNLLISALVGLVLIIVGIFEFIPVITKNTQFYYIGLMEVIIVFAILAMILNLIREWVKDCEDINGDHVTGRISLPIIMGRRRAARFITVFTLIFVFVLGYLIATYLLNNTIAMYYTVFLIMAPLAFVALKIWNVSTAKQFRTLSQILKLVMITGIFAMLVLRN